MKKVLARQRKQKRNKQGWGKRHANGLWVARNRDNICAWDLRIEWSGSINPKKISTNEWELASIFEVWNQKKKWKKNGQTKWQMKTKHVQNEK